MSARRMLGSVVGMLLIALASATWAAPWPEAIGQQQAEPKADTPSPALLPENPLPKDAVRRFGTLRFRHNSSIFALAWSPDGKTLATSAGNEVWLWDAVTGKVVQRLEEIGHGVRYLGFSPDGSHLACSGSGEQVQVWDYRASKKRFEVSGIFFVFSADGKTLFSGGKKASPSWGNVEVEYVLSKDPVQRWDTVTGQKLPSLGRGVPIAVSAGGKFLAAIEGKNPGDEKSPFFMVGEQVLSLWDTKSGKEVATLPLKKGVFQKGSFTPDGLCYALSPRSIEESGGLWLWTPGKPPRQLPLKFFGRAKDVFFSADGKQVALIDATGVCIRDLPSGKEFRRLPKLREESPLAFSPDKRRLAVGDASALGVWDLATGKEISHGEGHRTSLSSASLSRDGRLVCTIDGARLVHLWAWNSGKIVRTWDYPNHDPFSTFAKVAFSPDDRLIAGTAGDGISLWDVRTGKPLPQLVAQGFLNCPTFTPNGKFLAAGAWNSGGLALWETGTGINVWKIQEKGEGRRWTADLAFSPDGQLLAVTGGGETIRLRKTATGELLRELPSIECAITEPQQHLAFSSSGHTLVHSHPGTIRLFEMSTYELRLEIKSPMEVETLAISPDYRLLATGGTDIQLWDALTGQEVYRFSGHQGRTRQVAFTADGRHLLSCSDDTTAILWKVPELLWKKPADAVIDDLRQWWLELAGREAAKAYQAQGKLVAAKNAVSFLGKQLQPATTPDAKQVARWIHDLGDNRFAIREQAKKALMNLDDAVQLALRETSLKPLTLETRLRVQQLLKRLETLTTEQLQALRALEVLEWIGTPPARTLVVRLAQGAAGARITTVAQETLRRMQSKKEP